MRKIKYDFSKLRGKICEEYKCVSNFSKVAKISPSGMSQKLNNITKFTSDDIYKIIEVLKIENEDIKAYFFTKKV